MNQLGGGGLNVSHLKSQHLWAESRGDDGGDAQKMFFWDEKPDLFISSRKCISSLIIQFHDHAKWRIWLSFSAARARRKTRRWVFLWVVFLSSRLACQTLQSCWVAEDFKGFAQLSAVSSVSFLHPPSLPPPPPPPLLLCLPDSVLPVL